MNFPFPQELPEALRNAAAHAAVEYLEHRRALLRSRQFGLTKMHNLINDDRCSDDDVQRIRHLRGELDRAAASCYGWSDMDWGSGFHKNERGQTRFTVAPETRLELLRRLFELNDEVAARQREPGRVRARGVRK